MGISPRTRVLTSDFQWRTARTLCPGDELVCLDRSGRYWDIARIWFIDQVRQPGWRLDLAWGSRLEGTGDQLVYVMSKEPTSDSPAEGVWASIDEIVAKELMPLMFLGGPWKNRGYGGFTPPDDDPRRVADVYAHMCATDDIKGERMVIEWVREQKEFDLKALPNRQHRGMTYGPSPMRLPRTERVLMTYGHMRALPDEGAPHVTGSNKLARAKALEIVTTSGTLLAEGFALHCANG